MSTNSNLAQPHTDAENLHSNVLEAKETSISQWVHDHGDELYAWACRSVKDDAIAQDLVQETFISAFQSYDAFAGKSQPKTWLYSILKNKISDHYRKSAREAVSVSGREERRAVYATDEAFNEIGKWKANSAFHDWGTEAELLDNPEFEAVLGACLGKLPNSWQSMMHSRYLLEKNTEEICQELEISTSNYWQILHRSRLALKKCIEVSWFNK